MDHTAFVNGGPEIPLADAVTQAVGTLRGKLRDTRQTDIEDDTGLGRDPGNAAKVGGIAAGRLRSIVERVERLTEEKAAIASDIKDIFAEAKSAGFEVKVLRALIAIRKQHDAVVQEHETLLDLYRRALDM
jgi:uncharacterized protein (UPF0335 family)